MAGTPSKLIRYSLAIAAAIGSILGSIGIHPGILFVVVVVDGCLIFPEIRDWLADIFAGLHYRAVEGKVLPAFTEAESHYAHGRYEEAGIGYRDIITHHPELVRPWIGLMKVALAQRQGFEEVSDIYQEACHVFKKSPSAQDVLDKNYRGLISRVKLPGDNRERVQRRMTKAGSRARSAVQSAVMGFYKDYGGRLSKQHAPAPSPYQGCAP